jgi:hypothetical protein
MFKVAPENSSRALRIGIETDIAEAADTVTEAGTATGTGNEG